MIDAKILKDLENYCELNDIDPNEFITMKLNEEKYGKSPFDNENRSKMLIGEKKEEDGASDNIMDDKKNKSKKKQITIIKK